MNTWIEITLAPVIIGAVAFAVYVVLGSVIAMRRSLVEIQLLLDEYVTAITASPGLQDLKTPRTWILETVALQVQIQGHHP